MTADKQNDPWPTTSIQTWGKKVRYLGAAHSGTGAARVMHLTSVALMPLAIAFVWVVVRLSRMDFAAGTRRPRQDGARRSSCSSSSAPPSGT